ncbi:hypothetical protein PV768_01255 [Pseudarthrobacter sp. CC4]|uniref:hypothetical protein n=1 Tax=Pseudarthrobacter sp. CC4 TaxID=3029190 RepID=UPI003B8CE0CA
MTQGGAAVVLYLKGRGGPPGAVPAIVDEIKAAADYYGFDNAGQVVSRFSQVHAGTHVPGCEDAIGESLVAGP